MINETRHIIEKVNVDVEVGTMTSAEKIKDEINDFIKNEVLPIVESCFAEAEHDLGDQIIRLDKMELSVDTASWNIHSNKFKQEIRSEVEKQMKPILERANQKKRVLKEEIVDQSEAFMVQDLQVYAKDERVLRSLFHFLEQGTMPWWVNSLEESRQLFSEKVLLDVIRQNVDLVKRELEKIAHLDRFHERLIQQFPTSIVTSMLAIRLSESSNEHRDAEAIREMEALSRDVAKKVLTLIWQLSDDNSKAELFDKASLSLLFRHIHTHFYHRKLDHDSLNAALRTTHSALRFLFIVSDRNEELDRTKTKFLKSLNKRAPKDVLDVLKTTAAYEALISDHSDNSDLKSSESTASNAEKEAESVEKSSKLPNQESTKQPEDASEINEQPNLISDSDIREENMNISTDSSTTEADSSVEMNTEIASNKKDTPDQRNEQLNKDSEPFENQGDDRAKNADQINEQLDDKSLDVDNEIGTDNIKTDSLTSKAKLEGDLNNQPESKFESNSNNQGKSTKSENKDERMDQSASRKAETAESKEVSKLQKVLNERAEEAASKMNEADQALPDYLFVNNAGLVLLNPFLPALFKHLELVSESGKLTDPELAACILHYAATGREGDFEFEMTFEKYLCGIPPSVTMNKEITLSEIQKEEVEKVLNSVLTYWEVMKNKPIALLQNEFLMRPGKLITEKTNHRLVIERKTFDLLLDKLPWSYSMIKFSWRKEMIFVEW